MVLTPKQQRIVEENMGLVGKVIKDKVHGIGQQGVFTYEELFQIGCISCRLPKRICIYRHVPRGYPILW